MTDADLFDTKGVTPNLRQGLLDRGARGDEGFSRRGPCFGRLRLDHVENVFSIVQLQGDLIMERGFRLPRLIL